MKCSPSHYTSISISDKIPRKKKQKSVIAYFELSTAVIAVEIKVINASLTQNKRLQCVTPP